jgi:hypothetical protein
MMLLTKARIFMQSILMNIYKFMHTKIQKVYKKNSLLCVKKIITNNLHHINNLLLFTDYRKSTY